MCTFVDILVRGSTTALARHLAMASRGPVSPRVTSASATPSFGSPCNAGIFRKLFTHLVLPGGLSAGTTNQIFKQQGPPRGDLRPVLHRLGFRRVLLKYARPTPHASGYAHISGVHDDHICACSLTCSRLRVHLRHQQRRRLSVSWNGGRVGLSAGRGLRSCSVVNFMRGRHAVHATASQPPEGVAVLWPQPPGDACRKWAAVR